MAWVHLLIRFFSCTRQFYCFCVGHCQTGHRHIRHYTPLLVVLRWCLSERLSSTHMWINCQGLTCDLLLWPQANTDWMTDQRPLMIQTLTSDQLKHFAFSEARLQVPMQILEGVWRVVSFHSSYVQVKVTFASQCKRA